MKIAVLSLGNPLKQDDNIGNLIVDKLQNKFKDNNFNFFQAFLSPESYIIPLKELKPDIIYFIDAVESDDEVGKVSLFDIDDVITLGASSTHSIPVTAYKNHLPDAKIRIIGIKVKETGFGENLTEYINEKFDDILEEVEKIIS
ncbi:MAG: hydrogenase maturation protease [Nanoarchaeota archaeon]|nr:hydrogenase maturation protease [Nanoarchaeota archaeon]MCG2717473.1 hydrogenase maturation protease [Nanoarchaeota archaeon]